MSEYVTMGHPGASRAVQLVRCIRPDIVILVFILRKD